MDSGVLLLHSLLNSSKEFLDQSKKYLEELSKCIENNSLHLVDEEEFKEQEIKFIFVTSGGTSKIFKKVTESVKGPFFFITTKTDNSLAAALEMLSYSNEMGVKGEIIHGSKDSCAKRMEEIINIFSLKAKLKNTRLGVIGYPDLIASSIKPEVLKSHYGASLITITMEEFFKEIDKFRYEDNKYTLELKEKSFNLDETEKALCIYGAVRRLVDKYNLQGVAVRCFDLLKPYNNTGCLALAILNAQGIYAACEADSRSLFSMFVVGELSKKPVFMANPSVIDTDKCEMVLAHCVLPLTMPKSYKLTTHFESGIGVAVKGELEKTTYTLFKCWEDGRYFVQLGALVENLNQMDLCRTQVRLKIEDCKAYLTSPLSNHQMMVEGDYKSLVNEFFSYC